MANSKMENMIKMVMSDIKYLEELGLGEDEIIESNWDGYINNKRENEKIVKEAFSRCGYAVE